MTKILKFGILFILSAYFLTCTPTKTYQDRRLSEYIDSLIRKNNFNGSLLIAANDQIVYKGSYGLANFDTGEQLNDSSIFLEKVLSITVSVTEGRDF